MNCCGCSSIGNVLHALRCTACAVFTEMSHAVFACKEGMLAAAVSGSCLGMKATILSAN